MRTFLICLVIFAGQALANAESGTVEDVLSDLKKGNTPVVRTDQFTNAATSAVIFLKNIDILGDEKIRLKVVQFSVALLRRSEKPNERQVERSVEAFVIQMAKILKEDPSERVREEVAKSLLETIPAHVLDRHQAALRLAAEERKDIATLLAYASLSACDTVWLEGMVRLIKPESRREKYQLDSILARCGDQTATDRLIAEAGHLQGISDVDLDELVAALVFVPSERIQKYLGLGLRSDTVVLLAGGGTIPWRNCCARVLVRIHRHNEGFPVKKDDYIYSDDDLSKIEQWCVDNLGMAPPNGVRRNLRVTPSIQL